MELSEIGQSIKWYRKRARLTQHELAEIIGKTESSIRKYEKGLVQIPIDVVEKIAHAFGVPPFQLMADYWDVKNPEIKKQVDTIEGLLALLNDIYGHAELKWIQGESGAESCYYLVGEGEKQFILHEGDIDNLVELAKESIKPLVERIKDIRTEQEVIDDFLSDLNSPETKKRIEDFETRLNDNSKET